MFHKYLILVSLTTLFTVQPLLSQNDVSANATRPSASDNAYLTARGYAELELGAAVMDNFWSVPALLKFAPTERLELGVAMSGILNHIDTGNGGDTEAGDPGVQVKAQLANDSWGGFAVAGRVDFVSDLDPTFTGYAVVSYLTPSFQLDATLGGSSFDTGNGSDQLLSYAVAVSPKVKGKLGGFAELFGQSGDGFSPLAVDFGLAYAKSARFIIDTALAIGLNDDAPDWQVQFGFTSTLFQLSR